MSEIEAFYARLNRLIKQRNTTQEWVCKNIGLNLGTFRNRQTAKIYPNIYEGVSIAKLLDTTAEFLVSGENPHELEADDVELLRKLNTLSQESKETIKTVIETLYDKQLELS